jgi:RNA polymerase sigma factor (sigma-70 family)
VTALIHYVRKIVGRPGAQAGDAELLDQFAQRQDPEAFADLLRRHGPMVWRVCRRALPDEQDAEDAFQATFLVLVRKAGSLGRRDLLANWLFGVARRTTAKARSAGARRRLRQAALPADDLPDPRPDRPVDDLQAVLDSEIARLPGKYRQPFVLCYLEGRTNEEAAHAIGCPTGTVQSRLSWARERLRRRLARHGLAVTLVALTELLAGLAQAAAVPPPLAAQTARAALCFAAGNGLAAGAVSAPVAALTEGVLHAMFVTKLKTALVAALVLLLAGLAAGFIAPSGSTAGNASAAEQQQPPPSTKQVDQDPPKDKKTDRPQKKRKARPAREDSRATAKAVESKTFKTGKAPTVILETFNGGINVAVGEGNTVKVEVTKQTRAESDEAAKDLLKKIELTTEQDGDTIRVKATGPKKHPPRTSLGASAELKVPKGAKLQLRTANGRIGVAGGTGEARLTTANGRVTVKDHPGALNVQTANGRIEVQGGQGSLQLRTANGRIIVQAKDAKLTAQTSNSRIEFTGTLAEGNHILHTSNGRVVVTLPADTNFKVKASTSNGRVTSDFKVQTTGKARKNRLEGQTGENPKISLDIHTANGGIALKSQK